MEPPEQPYDFALQQVNLSYAKDCIADLREKFAFQQISTEYLKELGAALNKTDYEAIRKSILALLTFCSYQLFESVNPNSTAPKRLIEVLHSFSDMNQTLKSGIWKHYIAYANFLNSNATSYEYHPELGPVSGLDIATMLPAVLKICELFLTLRKSSASVNLPKPRIIEPNRKATTLWFGDIPPNTTESQFRAYVAKSSSCIIQDDKESSTLKCAIVTFETSQQAMIAKQLLSSKFKIKFYHAK